MTTMLICIVYCISNMYIVAIFALALLSSSTRLYVYWNSAFAHCKILLHSIVIAL